MDRIIDALHKAGIKVILGTPTYSIPSWLAAEHPEVLSQTWDGGQSHYGIRQNMDLLNDTYRRYSERIIRKMMEHYAQHPAIIGYQVDNEVEARKIDNPDYFEGFREYIKQEFGGDLKELNRRWGLNYWGMNINRWKDFYDRKGVTNPSYKVWWERWNRKVTADFLNWQADIVSEYKRPDQFIMHCFMPSFYDIDQVEAFRQMEYPAINVYYIAGTDIRIAVGIYAQSYLSRSAYAITAYIFGIRDQRPGYGMVESEPVATLRRTVAPEHVRLPLRWCEHGGILALEHAALRSRDLLARHPRSRRQAQPRLSRVPAGSQGVGEDW